MQKKLFSLWVLLLIFCTFPLFAQSWKKYDWQEISSCIDFNKQLKQLLKNKNLKEENYKVQNYQQSFFDLGKDTATSTAFFTIYDEKTHTLILVQGPKNTETALVSFEYVKKIAKFRLPKSFSQVATQFFWEQFLIITAVNQYDEKKESLVLIYEITHGKVKPVHAFSQTGELVKTQLQNNKLYIVTVDDIAKTTIENIVKHKIPETTIFPLLNQGLAYGLPMTGAKTGMCRGLKYFFDDKLPKVWSFLVIDLNNPLQEKEYYPLFWNFEEFVFSDDFLYTSQTTNDQWTLIQRFLLEPKINYQKSIILSGNLLSNGLIPRGTKSSIITTLFSGKFGKYLVSNFDSHFVEVGTKEILSRNKTFNSVEVLGNQLFLASEDEVLLALQELGKWSKIPTRTLSLPKAQRFVFEETPLSFLELLQTNGKISFSFFSEQDWSLKQGKNFSYSQRGSLIWAPLWNREKGILLLTLKKWSSLFLRWLTIDGKKQRIKEIFARKYKIPSNWKLTIENFSDFTYVVGDNLIDVFMPKQPKNMKILKN